MAGRKKSRMPISSALGSSVLLPAGLGFRNVLINGDFRINQRSYSSGTNLASGSYGFDRWKSAFTNTSLAFTSNPQGQIITISSGGSIEQVVERQNILPGTYILSWEGTATGRVYNSGATPPAFASSPILVTLDGLANVEVEFTASGSTKTLWKPQLELNYQVTPFEQRPIGIEDILCKRYYQVWSNSSNTNFMSIGTSLYSTPMSLSVPMRPLTNTSTTFVGVVYAQGTSYSLNSLTVTVHDASRPQYFTLSGTMGGSWNYSWPICTFNNHTCIFNSEL